MNVFDILGHLPPFLEIRLKGTTRVWLNASPKLHMIGGQIWLSYGIENMEWVMYERADTAKELEQAVLRLSSELAGKESIEVDAVFLSGSLVKAENLQKQVVL